MALDIEDGEEIIMGEGLENMANNDDDNTSGKIQSLVPFVGMLFDTDKTAYDFYNQYAKAIGFSVRKKTMYSDAKGIVRRRDLCCSWEGYYHKKDTPLKRRDDRRCGCKAMMMVKFKDDSKKYIVTVFMEEHNHQLEDPQNAFTLRSHRQVDHSQQILAQNMRSSGLRATDIFAYLCTEAGGAENLNFLESDLNNFLSQTRTNFLRKGDSECFLDYLRDKEKENRFFFHKIRTDSDNRICGFFIADAKSRCDYGNFGDVVCFDTTFKTNNYNMVCAPIVGVNNHGQTVLFGCGLLDSETTQSFVWFFETFLEAMGGKHPITIFTDQAMAISNAIEQVLPNTHHRLCLWHLFKNAATHLSSIYNKFETFLPDFRGCIYEQENDVDFEGAWNHLLTHYGLEENKWLNNLYLTKEKWAQVFVRQYFGAGMTTTQRSESINKFLKKFFTGNLILREFVGQFDKALASRRMKERLADSNNRKSRPNLVTDWVVEREASTKYTRKIFKKFQAECVKCFVLKLELLDDNGFTCHYTVRKIGKPNARTRKLSCIASQQVVSCSCKKFEFQGILCSHALKLFLELEVSKLPSHYYLSRWSMNAAANIVYDSRGEIIHADLDPFATRRYSELSHCAQTLVAKGTGTVEKHAFAMSEMLLIIKSLDSIKEQGNTFCASTSSAQEKQVDESNMGLPSGDVLLRDPIPKQRTRQHKGRHKGVLEKGQRKRKNTTSYQVESPTGTSNALPDEDQILEATNGSVQSTLDSWVPQAYNGPSGYYPLNTCMYPDLSMAQSFPFHQHGPPSMPMMSFNHSLLYSQASVRPSEYIIQQDIPNIQARAESSRPPARKLDFVDFFV